MKNSLSSLLLAFTLISAGATLPAFVAAQAMPPAEESFDASSPVTTAPAANTFDLRWLLPLLVVPVLYFVLRSTNSDEDVRSDFDSGLAGTKGGRARRDDFDDDVI